MISPARSLDWGFNPFVLGRSMGAITTLALAGTYSEIRPSMRTVVIVYKPF